MRFTPRAAALLTIILLAAPAVAAAEPPNPMATPTPTPGLKINTEVAPRILLRSPKPTACPGAKSTDFLLSSCSGAPGTHLTLTTTLASTQIPGVGLVRITPKFVLFTQIVTTQKAPSSPKPAPNNGVYDAPVELIAGAYALTVPQLSCKAIMGAAFNGGSLSFGLTVAAPAMDQMWVSPSLGTFKVICATAAPTATPAVTHTPTATPWPYGTAFSNCGLNFVSYPSGVGPEPFVLSSCSGAPGTKITLKGGSIGNGQLSFSFGYQYPGGPNSAPVNPWGSNLGKSGIFATLVSSAPGVYTFIVPQPQQVPQLQLCNLLVPLFLGNTPLGQFMVRCPGS